MARLTSRPVYLLYVKGRKRRKKWTRMKLGFTIATTTRPRYAREFVQLLGKVDLSSAHPSLLRNAAKEIWKQRESFYGRKWPSKNTPMTTEARYDDWFWEATFTKVTIIADVKHLPVDWTTE